MAEIHLTQSEADALIAIEKHRADENLHHFPQPGDNLSIPLVSADRREHFFLDLARGRINLLKGRYQTRGRQIVVLLRLDFGGAPHRNPDGQEVSSPHLHVYRESYGDKWAVPLPTEHFPNIADRWATLEDFMAYCNITHQPKIQRGLFS